MGGISVYRNLNDINTLKSDKDVKSAISHICKDILEYMKADSISVYVFNKLEDTLVPFVEQGDIENFIDGDKYKHDTFGKHYEDDFFETYKLCLDYEFIGRLNIRYKPEYSCKDLYSEFINDACKLISIIIRGWLLNKEIVCENKKRAIVENELDEYLNKSADFVCIYDENGKLVNSSSNWDKILGWSKEYLLNWNIGDCIHCDDKKIIENLNEHLSKIKVKTNRKASIKVRNLCKNGSYKWIQWNIEYSKKVNGYFVTGKDITEKIIEEERQINLEERVKLESMKNDLFTNLSHEFKTPLNIILGTMQVMEKNANNAIEISNDDLNRYLKNIKQNSYRLLKLVNNLTDISKMDIGCYNVNLSKNNIVNIIEDICSSVVEYAKNKNIEIIFDTDCEEILMACDPDAIERVVLNLLSNAIKYSSNEEGKILVSIRDDEEFVFVAVKDNGQGIPKDKLHVIFDRFEQVKGDFERKCEGSGIGLYLVQSIIKLHGGNIKVESVESKGSTFTFKLPKNLVVNEEIKGNRLFGKNNSSIEKCKIEFSDIYN